MDVQAVAQPVPNVGSWAWELMMVVGSYCFLYPSRVGLEREGVG